MTGAIPSEPRIEDLPREHLIAFVYGLASVIGGYAMALDRPSSRGLGARDLMLLVATGVGNIEQVGDVGGRFAQVIVRQAFDPKARPPKGGHLKAV